MLNKFKRQMAATIAAAMMLSTTAFANTAFTDVKPSDWYYSTVTKLADTGIINGTGDGSFNPTGEVGIDSFIKMLVTARKMEVGTGTTDYWAEPYLETMYQSGFRDSSVMPYRTGLLTQNNGRSYDFAVKNNSRPLTREHMAVLIDWCLKQDGTITNTTQFDTTAYTDFSSINKEYNTAVRSVIINGIMGGKGNGRFDAQGTVTRAEAAAVIARYMYPEERISYNYTAKEEKHNVGDIYTDYNTWIVPTEVKVYETGQAIPTICENAKLYVEELGKYIYVGMPVAELESIMGGKAIQQAGFNNYIYYNSDNEGLVGYSINGEYLSSITIATPYHTTYNGHSTGEAPLLMETYSPRSEFEEVFSNGGAVDLYPYIHGKIGNAVYFYYNNGYTQAYLDRNGIPNGTAMYHLPTEIGSIYLYSNTVLSALAIK